jgi:hypothetical protein
VFGGNKRVGYVDIKDAPGMLAMADGGRRVFRVYVKAPETKVEILEDEPVLEMQVATLDTATGETSTATKPKRNPRRK